MTPTQYRDTIAALGLNQSSAARLFGVDPRTSRRWASGDMPVPRAVELALRIMLTHGVTPSQAASLLSAA